MEVRELTGTWDRTLERRLEKEIELLRDALEGSENRDLAGMQYLCGQIRGIRLSIECLNDIRKRYNRDGDIDVDLSA